MSLISNKNNVVKKTNFINLPLIDHFLIDNYFIINSQSYICFTIKITHHVIVVVKMCPSVTVRE